MMVLPGERAAEDRANSREVLASRRAVLKRSHFFYLAMIENNAIPVKYASGIKAAQDQIPRRRPAANIFP